MVWHSAICRRRLTASRIIMIQKLFNYGIPLKLIKRIELNLFFLIIIYQVNLFNMETGKTLGIMIVHQLEWIQHTYNLSKSFSNVIFSIRRLRVPVSFNKFKLCYFTLFHLRISYAIPLWGQISTAKSIFIMEKSVIRVVIYTHFGSQCKPLRHEHKIKSI